jgi:hypothetical protein
MVSEDDKGEGPPITQGSRNIGSQQTAFDAELAAIEKNTLRICRAPY